MANSSCEVIPREVLCCPLCKEEYKQPRLLPCLHSYCLRCLENHLNHPNNRTQRCPECNCDIALNGKGLHKLPQNLFVQRLSDPRTTTNEMDTKCRQCDMSGETTHALCRCVNCDEYICTACTERHQQEDETSSHKVEPLQQPGEDQNASAVSTTQSPVQKCCELYDRYDIGALFCVDCEMAVCADCHAKSHQEHRCAELSAVVENFETKVNEPLADLEDNANQLCDHLANLDQTEKDVEVKQKQIQEAVKQRKQFLCEMLENYEQTLLAEIDRRFEQNLAQIHHQKHQMEKQVSSINAVINFTDNLLAYGTDEEKVAMRKRIGRRIRDLCEDEIPEDIVSPYEVKLDEPMVTVETVCDMFGELAGDGAHKLMRNHQPAYNQASIDSGHFSEANDDLVDLGASFDSRLESDPFPQRFRKPPLTGQKSVQFDDQVTKTEFAADKSFNLDDPIREFQIPAGIERDCIKGMGINTNGDIIIGTVFSDGQCIYIVEKHGIIRGKIPVEKGWNIHSVAGDGKVAMTVNRGDNRYKVRVLHDDCSTSFVKESYIQTYGLNFVTANSSRQVIVASNRYGKVCGMMGKSAKSGGNIAIHDKDGHLMHRITNETYQDFNLYVLEKPCSIAVDNENNIYVADSGSHLVVGFTPSGDLLFTFGNSDTNEDEVYQGPDYVCLDQSGNVIVTDKRANRIDILTGKGQLVRTLYTPETPKFVAAGQGKQLMVTTVEGIIQFYDYL